MPPEPYIWPDDTIPIVLSFLCESSPIELEQFILRLKRHKIFGPLVKELSELRLLIDLTRWNLFYDVDTQSEYTELRLLDLSFCSAPSLVRTASNAEKDLRAIMKQE